MERNSPESEPIDQRLPESEMAGIFSLMSEMLVRNGSYKIAPEVYTPSGYPDALQFCVEVRADIIKEMFYPGDETVEILTEGTHLNYLTPHTLDDGAEQTPEASVALNIRGRFAGTQISFSTGYLIARYDEAGPHDDELVQKFVADVYSEYYQGGRVLEDDAIEVAGDIVAFSSRSRHMTLQDGNRLRRLVDILS